MAGQERQTHQGDTTSDSGVDELQRRLAVARGAEPADTVLTGGRIFAAHTREWLDGDVAIVDGVVAGIGAYDGAERIDVAGSYLVPGFIDAHMHFESSRLLPDEYARVVLPQGTTTLVADPHEIANVLGADGVDWFVDSCADLPLEIYFMAPSSVPASPLESPRGAMHPADIVRLLRRDRVIGIAEIMNFPGVILGDGAELAKLLIPGRHHVDGHAPGVVGRDLAAYAAAGIASDHEAFTQAEGIERLRAGMWLLIRESSPARNLDELVPLLRDHPDAQIAFCTDDLEPEDLPTGQIAGMVRRAVAAGVAPEVAIAAATLNAARCHGLRHLGAIAPGFQADILVLDDLERYTPRRVLKRGRAVGEITRPSVPEWVRRSVNIGTVDRTTFAIPCDAASIRVIGLVPRQIVTRALTMAPTLVDGCAVADPARDLAKIVVVERHHATGRVGRGFVAGSGLRRGALASSVAHDAHNIVAVGMSDADLAVAVRRVHELQGGIVAVDSGRVVAESPLAVGGLMSVAPADQVIAEGLACTRAAADLGWKAAAPFLTMSFLALSVIPELKLSDQGLVDVVNAAIVPLGIA